MLPGLTRTAAHPASIAWNTYFGWKWMSAMTGIWLFFAMMCSTSASSWLGTATRTMSQPEAVSSAICCRVPLMFVVAVVVIDWTLTGASPPTRTLPTRICRDLRRGARTSGTFGIPRFTAGTQRDYAAPLSGRGDAGPPSAPPAAERTLGTGCARRCGARSADGARSGSGARRRVAVRAQHLEPGPVLHL